MNATANWRALMEALPSLSEKECEKLLKEEVKGQGRKKFIERLHSRFSRLRNEREREEYLS